MAFRCEICGHRSAKWMGFCPQCGSNEPLAEEPARPATSKAKGKKSGSSVSAKARATAALPVEPEEAEEEAVQEGDLEPRRPLRVLQNPYDISSFYRADGGRGDFASEDGTERYPIAGFYRQDGGQGPYAIAGYYRQDGSGGRYPIAGFYRQPGGRGAYGGFWNSGYGPRSRGRATTVGNWATGLPPSPGRTARWGCGEDRTKAGPNLQSPPRRPRPSRRLSRRIRAGQGS